MIESEHCAFQCVAAKQSLEIQIVLDGTEPLTTFRIDILLDEGRKAVVEVASRRWTSKKTLETNNTE